MYSLQSSLAERERKKRPTLDIATPRKSSFSPLSVPLTFSEKRQNLPQRKRLDGLVRERSFLEELKNRPWQESAKRFWRRAEISFRRVKRLSSSVMPSFSPHKMLYGSIVGGIAFGMVSMAFMEHYFGPGVFARSEAPVVVNQVGPEPSLTQASPSEETGAYDPGQDVFFEYFGQVTKEKYEESIRDMVKGYPIEAMLPYIFKQDRLTAAFLVGIAKKESNWGKRIPVLDNQDCFNYWGYRGVRRMMGTGGHTCFNSREDAVETVAARLNRLIQSEKLDTPEKMIIWKCGFSCQGHSRESVKKWISDVDMYFSQLSDE
jgi:hypothetical protein